MNSAFLRPLKLYEEPEATSDIVVNVNVEQNVTRVNEHTNSNYVCLIMIDCFFGYHICIQ